MAYSSNVIYYYNYDDKLIRYFGFIPSDIAGLEKTKFIKKYLEKEKIVSLLFSKCGRAQLYSRKKVLVMS